jgi:transcriptional regulator with XRE-family HTH domain
MNGAKLKKARERLRLTQSELAGAIGMKRNSIARMERNERPVLKHTELAVRYLLLTMRKTKGGNKTHGNQQNRSGNMGR